MRWWSALLKALWLLAAAAAIGLFQRYSGEAGAAPVPRDRWPAVALEREAGKPTLVMLLHPRCPCSQASVAELERLLARAPVAPRTFVVFFKPGAASAGWEQTSLWERASRIPGVTVVTDGDGALAAAFGATTSGHTILFDYDGRLRFGGGITASRGHEGDNAGKDAILALLAETTPTPNATTETFGCALFEAARAAQRRLP